MQFEGRDERDRVLSGPAITFAIAEEIQLSKTKQPADDCGPAANCSQFEEYLVPKNSSLPTRSPRDSRQNASICHDSHAVAVQHAPVEG
jgi:hypothetical protein